MKTHIQRQTSTKRIQSQINITPLIDVLLVLLVIFMVITPVTPTGLNAAIPKQVPAINATPEPQQSSLVLSVDSEGTMRLNRSMVNSTAELVTQLRDIFKTRNDRTVFVQGARSLNFDVMAQVIDAAVGSGAVRIGLLTDEIR